ncbi:MAG: T9SS type A sorting domain-containing protein [Bacteroidetes bacterium]|nr:T9SS type A sorting domain-containing protein [Bacteroidota bacterium]
MKHILLLITITCIYTSSLSQNILPMGEGIKCQGTIKVIETDLSTGAVYVAGYFDAIEGINANNIAGFDGSIWSNLGGGPNGYVYDIKAVNGNVYTGGSFTTMSGFQFSNLAVWDGLQWTGIGTTGPNGYVSDIEYYNGALYIAGSFSNVDGVPADYLAKFENNTWSPIGSGINARPIKMKVHDGKLFLCGPFTTFNGSTAMSLAWIDSAGVTGGSNILAPGNLMNFYVLHDTIGVITNSAMYRFDGLQYTNDLPPGYNAYNGFTYQDTLYMVHDSIYSGNGYSIQDRKITKVTQNSHSGDLFVTQQRSIGASFIPEYEVFHSNDSALYVGGSFKNINGNTMASMFKSSASGLSNFGKCASRYIDPWQNANVYCSYFDSLSGKLWVGGSFLFADNQLCSNIAIWDGNSWSCPDSGFSGTVLSIVSFNGTIYASGAFLKSGNTTLNSIARFVGNQWEPVSSSGNLTGANKTIQSMIVANNQLYLGGGFNMIGGVSVFYLATYNGTQFQAVPGNASFFRVLDLEYYHGKLYLVDWIHDVYSFSGGSWTNINFQDDIINITLFNDTLYLGSDGKLIAITDVSTANVVPNMPMPMFNTFYSLPLGNKLIGIDNQYYGVYIKEGLVLRNISPYPIYPSTSATLDSTHVFIGGFMPYISTSAGQVNLNNVGILEMLPPTASISSNRDSVCELQYVFFYTQTNDLFPAYSWNFNGGGLPDSSKSQNPIVQYPTPGSYPVTMTISNLAGNLTLTLPQNIIVKPCITSNVEVLTIKQINAYPNPFTDEISLQTSADVYTSYAITNMLGEIILKGDVSKHGEQRLSLTTLSSGIYILECRGAKNISNLKLIKQ